MHFMEVNTYSGSQTLRNQYVVMLVYILRHKQHSTQKFAVQNINGIKIQKRINIIKNYGNMGGKKTQHKISVPI